MEASIKPKWKMKPDLPSEQRAYQNIKLAGEDEQFLELGLVIDELVTINMTWDAFCARFTARVRRDFRKGRREARTGGVLAVGPHGHEWASFDAAHQGTLWIRAPHEPLPLQYHPPGRRRLLMEGELWTPDYSEAEALGKLVWFDCYEGGGQLDVEVRCFDLMSKQHPLTEYIRGLVSMFRMWSGVGQYDSASIHAVASDPCLGEASESEIELSGEVGVQQIYDQCARHLAANGLSGKGLRRATSGPLFEEVYRQCYLPLYAAHNPDAFEQGSDGEVRYKDGIPIILAREEIAAKKRLRAAISRTPGLIRGRNGPVSDTKAR